MDDNIIYSNLSGKTVFLTGATGFIGSHLLRRLIKNGCNVHISIRKNSSLWRIEEFKESYFCHMIDLTDFDAVKLLIEQIKPEIIFNLAAYGVDYTQQDVRMAVNININASVNLFESFMKNNGIRFIHTGTCLEYGHKSIPVSENELLNPTSLYGLTKAASVQLLSMMARQMRNGNLVILRPFGVFGELEGSHKFFPQLIYKLKKGYPVQMTLGEQIRDYIYVEDLIDAYILASSFPLKNAMEIINIGSGKEIRLKEISITITKKLKANKNLLHFGALPYRFNEPMYLVANVDKAKILLGWAAKTSLEDGIEHLLKWYNKDGVDDERK